MKGIKHGLSLFDALRVMQAGATLTAADGGYFARFEEDVITARPHPECYRQYSIQIQRRAFYAMQDRDLIQFIGPACTPVYGKPSGGRWTLK